MYLKIGIDEAGRGPWAGPVFAGVVVLNKEQEAFLVNEGITDSKKLSAKKRERLFPLILQNSILAKVKFIPVEELDKVGIYEATKALIQKLAEEIDFEMLSIPVGDARIMIDGVFPGLEIRSAKSESLNHECIIKGDEKEPAISAASILAKVRRDAYMMKLHEKFPQYDFARHKGYGTKLHMEMLAKYGPCEEHRRSFKPVREILISKS